MDVWVPRKHHGPDVPDVGCLRSGGTIDGYVPRRVAPSAKIGRVKWSVIIIGIRTGLYAYSRCDPLAARDPAKIAPECAVRTAVGRTGIYGVYTRKLPDCRRNLAWCMEFGYRSSHRCCMGEVRPRWTICIEGMDNPLSTYDYIFWHRYNNPKTKFFQNLSSNFSEVLNKILNQNFKF